MISSEKKTPLERSTTPLDLKAGSILDRDLDQAELFLRDNNISHDDLAALLSDEAGVRKLVKRVDWHLMPLLCGTYLLQYLDKQSLSYAAVFDLFDSTNINSTQYSWLVSIFYMGYLICEWPASYVAQKLPTGTVVSCSVITWGSILMLTSACSNFTGLMVSFPPRLL
jgi:sugar phosphate permease